MARFRRCGRKRNGAFLLAVEAIRARVGTHVDAIDVMGIVQVKARVAVRQGDRT